MGQLFIISTPIGNLEDISLRALKTLYSLDILLCEDTRRAGILFQELNKRYPSFVPTDAKTPQLISYYDEIEFKKLPEIIELLEQDKTMGLISDAGTPLISDPGFTLVREVRKRNIPVTAIPGSSALLTALSISGLPINIWSFWGFFSDKQSQREKVLKQIQQITSVQSQTYIFYCSPHKLLESFQDIHSVLGNISLVVARELTKMHEEVWSGTVEEAISTFADPKGEFVLLFHL